MDIVGDTLRPPLPDHEVHVPLPNGLCSRAVMRDHLVYRILTVKGERIRLQLIDEAGQEIGMKRPFVPLVNSDVG